MINSVKNKLCLIFDFDHTLIKENSDVVLFNLLKNKFAKEKIKKDYKAHTFWTKHMNDTFAELYNEGNKRTDLENCLMSMSFVSGMGDVLSKYKNKADMFILSDSNSWIINHFLTYNNDNMVPWFKYIYTNPAYFDKEKNDLLIVKPYHEPEQNLCKICPSNLCKGSVVKSICLDYSESDVVCYYGDGMGDLCGCCSLFHHCGRSYAFVRQDFPLEKMIPNIEKASVNVILWKDGFDVLNSMRNLGL